MDFVKRMGQNVAKHRIGIQMKKWWWYLFVWMVDVALKGTSVLHCINQDKGDECLPLLAFWRDAVNSIFFGIFKGRQLSPSHIRIQNIPSNVCYDDTKHCKMKSECRRIQNLFKHLRWCIFAQTVNGLKSLTGHAKTLHLKCLKGFWIFFYWKARQV